MTAQPFLIFDLDGTLVDSIPDLTLATNLLREELDLEQISAQQVRLMVGDGASMLVKRALGETLYEERHLQRYLQLYEHHLLDNTACYPGVRELLAAHEPAKMAIVTNKPYHLSVKLLNGLGLSDRFTSIIGGDSLDKKKPHPMQVEQAIADLGCQPSQAVMIGDHHTDLIAGRAAGASICFCSYGIGHADGIDYDYRVESSEELLSLFPGSTCE